MAFDRNRPHGVIYGGEGAFEQDGALFDERGEPIGKPGKKPAVKPAPSEIDVQLAAQTGDA